MQVKVPTALPIPYVIHQAGSTGSVYGRLSGLDRNWLSSGSKAGGESAQLYWSVKPAENTIASPQSAAGGAASRPQLERGPLKTTGLWP